MHILAIWLHLWSKEQDLILISSKNKFDKVITSKVHSHTQIQYDTVQQNHVVVSTSMAQKQKTLEIRTTSKPHKLNEVVITLHNTISL